MRRTTKQVQAIKQQMLDDTAFILQMYHQHKSIARILDHYGLAHYKSTVDFVKGIIGDDYHDATKHNARTFTLENLRAATGQSICWSDVCRSLNISVCSYNFNRLKQLCIKNEINVSHFDSRKSKLKITNRTHKWTKDTVLVQHCTITRSSLRVVLKRLGLYPGKCEECGIPDVWNQKPLTIEIDHINGDHKDNREENLRWLCPNCHSQTPTFKIGNRVRRELVVNVLPNEKPTGIGSQLGRRKVARPSLELLQTLLWEMPTTKIAAQYNVSDNCVARWAKEYDLAKPPRGYWAKRKD